MVGTSLDDISGLNSLGADYLKTKKQEVVEQSRDTLGNYTYDVYRYGDSQDYNYEIYDVSGEDAVPKERGVVEAGNLEQAVSEVEVKIKDFQKKESVDSYVYENKIEVTIFKKFGKFGYSLLNKYNGNTDESIEMFSTMDEAKTEANKRAKEMLTEKPSICPLFMFIGVVTVLVNVINYVLVV